MKTKGSELKLYMTVGSRRLAVTCSEDDVQALMAASGKFQAELDKANVKHPDVGHMNKILHAGIQIADALIALEKQPLINEPIQKRLEAITKKVEALTRSIETGH